jgi:hypothetical protein
MADNEELWNIISLPSADFNLKIVQKLLVAGVLLYIDSDDILENLLFVLELLEKRFKFPDKMHHEYCMIIVDLRSLVLSYIFICLCSYQLTIDCITNDE